MEISIVFRVGANNFPIVMHVYARLEPAVTTAPFSYLSGPGDGRWFPCLIIAQKSANDAFLGHSKGVSSTRRLTSRHTWSRCRQPREHDVWNLKLASRKRKNPSSFPISALFPVCIDIILLCSIYRA